MTPNELAFAQAVPLLAKNLKLTPDVVLAVFGVLAAGIVEFAVEAGEQRQAAADTALAVFANNLQRALTVCGDQAPPPPAP